jgi:hypothetical protein
VRRHVACSLGCPQLCFCGLHTKKNCHHFHNCCSYCTFTYNTTILLSFLLLILLLPACNLPDPRLCFFSFFFVVEFSSQYSVSNGSLALGLVGSVLSLPAQILSTTAKTMPPEMHLNIAGRRKLCGCTAEGAGCKSFHQAFLPPTNRPPHHSAPLCRLPCACQAHHKTRNCSFSGAERGSGESTTDERPRV